MANRIQVLQKSFEKEHVDGCLITDEKNLLYFTGFLGATRLLIPQEGESVLFVGSVNYNAAKVLAKNCRVELLKRGEDADQKLGQQVGKMKLKSLGFDALDASTYAKVKKALKNAKLKPSSQMVWELRKVKDEAEIGFIRKATQLTDIAAQTAANVIKIGKREFEVAAEVEYAMRKMGSEGTAFETIVASGLASAYPHGGCTSKKIAGGELIQFDVGARFHNYAADLTRTFLIGKPTPKQKKIYDIVMEAQEKAFQKIRDGVKARLVDSAARNVIKKNGFGENFVHGLGHGVGLSVHEPPTLNDVSKDVLKTGNVVTDEPGVYIVGYGGIRIEDTVLVKKDGAERLTEAPCQLAI